MTTATCVQDYTAIATAATRYRQKINITFSHDTSTCISFYWDLSTNLLVSPHAWYSHRLPIYIPNTCICTYLFSFIITNLLMYLHNYLECLSCTSTYLSNELNLTNRIYLECLSCTPIYLSNVRNLPKLSFYHLIYLAYLPIYLT